MRIARDAFATLVTAIGLALALSVTQGWNWPVVGDSVRWGVVSLGLVSLFACGSSGWTTALGGTWYADPFIDAAIVAGTLTLAVGVIGLFTGSMAYLVWMMVGVVLLWLITTVHHVVGAAAGTARPVVT